MMYSIWSHSKPLSTVISMYFMDINFGFKKYKINSNDYNHFNFIFCSIPRNLINYTSYTIYDFFGCLIIIMMYTIELSNMVFYSILDIASRVAK